MSARVQLCLHPYTWPRRAFTNAFTSLVLSALLTSGAQAQSYSVIYDFCQGGNFSDAQNPVGDLIADAAGNLYGTTLSGGTYGEGTVFEVSAGGVETVLYSFGATPTDGREPLAGLVRDASGNLYGTTNGGGARGAGTVFQVTATDGATVLYSFTGLKDEGYPQTNLLLDGAGNLYGTTADFQTDEYGTVFKLSPGGKITELRTFTGPPSDGANPFAGLTRDRAGTLYGTTEFGGTYNLGAVFELNKAGADTVLYSFRGGASDGSGPAASLVRDAAGNLYGTTLQGGSGTCDLGCGTVFKVVPTGQETVLYTFSGQEDGAMPFSDLLLDPKGNFYGTASSGGSSSANCTGRTFSCGVVFKVTPAGKETVLHTFTGYPDDGSIPYGGLLHFGNYLYGTTNLGGPYQCGTVYRVTP